MKTLLLTLLAVFLLSATTAAQTPPAADRPAHWAPPLTVSGLPNLHQVSPQLYRSAQPTPAGFQNLRTLGIKTVVNLRLSHSDRSCLNAAGLDYIHIYMKAWHAETEDIVKFLKIVTDPGRTPVLVHCRHGADRTGTMVAVYRIAVQGWTKEEALKEMTQGGYGFHGIWENLLNYLNSLDIPAIKAAAGLQETR